MINSLSSNTVSQYNVAIKKWFIFCQLNNLDYYDVSVREILKFLTDQFQEGASYGTLNSFRSALSLIIGKDRCNCDSITRFFKGVFKMKPCFPKYSFTWDPNIVLEYLANIYPNDSITLEMLTKKLVTLLALSTGQRVQTLSVIDVNCIFPQNTYVAITIHEMIKTSMHNRRNPRLVIPYYVNEAICPAKALTSYMERTSQYRNLPNTDKLFITIKKPIHNASSQSLSRWIKQTMSQSGLDVTMFTAHSTRHASTSAANRSGVSIDLIKRTAGWTGNSLCFAKFYNQPLFDSEDTSFAEAVLSRK